MSRYCADILLRANQHTAWRKDGLLQLLKIRWVSHSSITLTEKNLKIMWRTKTLCVGDVIPGIRPEQLGSSPAAQSKANDTTAEALEQKKWELIQSAERKTGRDGGIEKQSERRRGGGGTVDVFLTADWRALGSSRHLFPQKPNCPTCQSARPPPEHTHTHTHTQINNQTGCSSSSCSGLDPLTCLKFPFLRCSQSIMSWKMGIMMFRTSTWGTSVTPRNGPIIPGMKWILFSPATGRREPTRLQSTSQRIRFYSADQLN